ncbi:glycoside hydrolase family 88/105 protein [Neptunicella marina]|uniref:Glycoside hydrolase family 88 protein n=1 Tax=Neptunicella marina TaxID=2125989 RepID=A0A8J6M1R8_9ALTE|nr:glycoside hydrolase family 88 protein [Neptunicella marina]MBC3765682.1 glycoside hydrolase family 88 protein [Neptunicella marina]
MKISTLNVAKIAAFACLLQIAQVANAAQQSWAERMVQSEMARHPEAWSMEEAKKPKWNYTQGLVLLAISKQYEKKPDPKLLAYIKAYADLLIDEKGDIRGYKMSDYNIDMINAGKILFFLYEQTQDPRYMRAMHIMREQIAGMPRTSEGGFWHKKRYPFQMWLDGLYMGAPFYAEYATWFAEDKDTFDDIAQQFKLIERHAKDHKTGLLYHGWDESRQQKWADPKTGTSPNFWSRSLGWYAMALVDVLEYFPKGHKDREFLIESLQNLAAAVTKVQDKSGLWYQVTDQGDRKGNYLEASGTSMLVYALAKGVNQGYLDKQYWQVAQKGYQGLLDKLIKVDSGLVNITQVCAVAGLGGDPYRSGSFDYYVNEKMRDNDPKATGPFIMASLELGK